MRITCRRISIAMLTESACMFSLLVESCRTSEKQAMIDLALTHKGYNSHEKDDMLDMRN